MGRRNARLSDSVQYAVGRAVSTMTRSFIDLLEAVEDESVRLAEEVSVRRRRSQRARRPVHHRRHTYRPETNRKLLLEFMNLLEEEACLFEFAVFRGRREHKLLVELDPDGAVSCARRSHSAWKPARYSAKGTWRFSESSPAQIRDGVRIDLDFFDGTDGALWAEPSPDAGGHLLVTVTRTPVGVSEFANAYDLFMLE